MKSVLLGGAAALVLSLSAAQAQSTSTPAATPSPAASTAASTNGGEFIDQQQPGLLRAPKLVGVAVYGSDNKSVGKIDDLLLDKDGTVKAVVIGIGGFLGIGKKDVAVPYSAIKWQTEARTVATNDAAPANGSMGGTTANGTTGTASTSGGTNATGGNNTNGNNPTMSGNTAQNTTKVDPAKTEAYQGYPDRAVIDMSQDQLKNAPEFKYASQTMNSDGTTKKQ